MRALSVLFLWVVPPVAVAGPWVHAPGDGYVKVGWNHFRSSAGFASGMPTGLAFRSHAVGVYAELGLPADLQLVLDVPWVTASNQGTNDVRYTHAWTGDVRVELDRKLSQKIPLAVGIDVRVPTYRSPSDFARARGLTEETLPAFLASFPELGDRNVDITAKVLVGGSFQDPGGWVTLETGPRLRVGKHADGWYAATSAGLWAVPEHLGVGVYANGNVNVLIPDDALPSKQLAYVQGFAFLTGLGPAPAMALEIGVGGVPWATDAAKGVGLLAGVSYRY